MKKVLEIFLREDGLSVAGVYIDTPLDGQRLAASLIALSMENEQFKLILSAAVKTIENHPEKVKALAELAKKSGAARAFMVQDPKEKN